MTNIEEKPRRTQALKEAQMRYRLKNKEKVQKINNKARMKYYYNKQRNKEDYILTSIRNLYK